MAETQVRQILIKVDTQGDKALRDVSRQLGQISKDVSTLSGLGSLLQSALSFSFLGFGIKQITDMSDAIQNVESRVKVLTGSASEARNAIEGILKVANETKTSFTDAAEVYSRLAVSLKNTGLSTQAVLDLTQLLQNSFRLSGSTSQEAAGAIIQLSQAFTSGQLRGQELRSVMTQNAFVADLLTKEFGKQENVYKQAERGLITVSKVLKLLYKNQDDINNKSKELSQTFSQTMTTAMNAFQKSVFDLNKELKISEKFVEGMTFVSERFSLIMLALGAFALPSLISKLTAFGAAIVAAATPMGIWVAALVALTGGIIYLSKNLDDFIVKAKQVGLVFVDIAAGVLDLGRKISYFIPGINLLTLAFESLDNFSIADTLKNYAKNTRESIAENIKLEKTIADIQRTAEKEHKTLEDIDKLNKLNKLKDKSTGKEDLARLNQAYLDLKVSVDEYYKAVKPIEVKKLNDEFKKGSFELEKYRLETDKLKLVNLNRDFNNGRIGIYEFNTALNSIQLDELNFKFQSAKITLGEYREELLKLDAQKLGQQFALGEISVEKYNQAVEDNKLSELKLKLDQGKLSWKEYRKEVDAVSTSLDSNGLIVRGSERYLDSIGSKANQIADAIKGAFSSLEDSLLEFINTGSQDFKRFAQSILDDINRIIIRSQIIAPIARGIIGQIGEGTPSVAGPTSGTNGFTQGPGGGGVVISQKAGGFLPSVPQPIYGANGEIISAPGSNTSVIVNITNNSSSEITQQESEGPNGERILDLIIQSKVKDGISNGSYDSVFGQSYGLRRRGV